MSRLRTLVLSSMLLTGTATIAHAQGITCRRIVCLAVSGGFTVPAADMADFHDAGFHYDAALLFNLPGLPLAIRPEFSLTQFKLKDTLIPTTSIDDVTKMYSAMANVELGLAGGLYVLAGAGLLSLNSADFTGTGADNSETKFTFDAGAGMRFKLGGISGFLEARVGSASYDQGTFAFEKAAFIPFTFGLVF